MVVERDRGHVFFAVSRHGADAPIPILVFGRDDYGVEFRSFPEHVRSVRVLFPRARAVTVAAWNSLCAPPQK